MGTVGYVAPEQIRGKGVDKRTDVYALGCVLFECLTGWQPFRRKDDFATIMAHVNDAPPVVSELMPGTPGAVDEVVRRALAKDPDDRYATCDDLGTALRRAAGAPTGLTPTPQTQPDLPAPAPSQGSVWFDASVDKLSGSRAEVDDGATAYEEPDYGATQAGAGAVDDGGETAWENPIVSPSDAPAPAARASSTSPDSAPASSDASAASSPPRRFPVAARAVLAVVALGCIVALAVVLLGGGDDDKQTATTTPPPAAAPPPNAGPAQDSSAWRVAATSPSARQQVATAVLNGKISLIGGLLGKDTATATTEVEAYDPAIDTWNTQTSLPRPLHHATAVGYRGELVVIGGWEPEGSNLTAKTSREVLALRNGRWVRLPSLRNARAAAAAAVVDDKIVVVGGQANNALVPATEIFDGTRWRDAAPLPTPREHLAAASDGRFVYAVGGRKRSSDQNTAVLERYDAKSDGWKALRSMPVATGSMGATIVNGRLVVVGGEGPSQVIKNVQSYDIAADRWSQLGAMRTPRHGLGVAAFGTTLYALDGARATGHSQSTNIAEALDLG